MRAKTLNFIRNHSPATTVLDLSRNDLDDYDVHQLLQELANFPQLESLNLSHNDFTHRSWLKILNKLTVKELQLNNSFINSDNYAVLTLLSQHKTINDLELDSCSIDDIGARILAKSKKITRLSLINNNITDVSMPDFAQNFTLTTLMLLNNPITEMGLALLGNNSCLKVLVIKNQNISQEKITDVIKKIRQNTRDLQLAVHKSMAFSQCKKSEQSLWSQLPSPIIQKILFFTFAKASPYQKALTSYLIFKNVQTKKWQTFLSSDEQRSLRNLAAEVYSIQDMPQQSHSDTKEGQVTLFR